MIDAMNAETEDIMHVIVVDMAVAVVGKFEISFSCFFSRCFIFDIFPNIWDANILFFVRFFCFLL